MIKNVTLKISSIASEQGIKAVDNTLRGLPGIISVAVKKSGSARMEIDVSYRSKQMSFERIRAAIVDLGHSVNGYIIHEHSHSHGDIVHNHSHKHSEEGDVHDHPHGH